MARRKTCNVTAQLVMQEKLRFVTIKAEQPRLGKLAICLFFHYPNGNQLGAPKTEIGYSGISELESRILNGQTGG